MSSKYVSMQKHPLITFNFIDKLKLWAKGQLILRILTILKMVNLWFTTVLFRYKS